MNLQKQSNLLANLVLQTEKQALTSMNIIFDLNGVILNQCSQEKSGGAFNAIRSSDIIQITHLLKDCVSLGHRLFLVSNWSKESYIFFSADPKIARVLKFFDDIVLTETIGLKKTDYRIFNHLIGKHHLDPRRCIFIDNQKSNLKAAQCSGINKNILCTNFNFTQLRQELEQHGAL